MGVPRDVEYLEYLHIDQWDSCFYGKAHHHISQTVFSLKFQKSQCAGVGRPNLTAAQIITRDFNDSTIRWCLRILLSRNRKDSSLKEFIFQLV